MKRILAILILLFAFTAVQAQDCIPAKPSPAKAVNDYTNTLTSDEQSYLESSLRAFQDTTSTAIIVVVVSDLCGYDKFTFTHTIAEQWGVGQDGKDNGVVIMIKPKEFGGKGEAEIDGGFGDRLR